MSKNLLGVAAFKLLPASTYIDAPASKNSEKLHMKAREGDHIETLDGNIFDVKGLVHPRDKVIAFIRFTPDSKGERKKGNLRYRKVYPLHERYTLLQERFPQYLVFDAVFNQWLCEVPIELVIKHYEPTKYLRQLRGKRHLQELEAQALQLTQLLQKNAAVNCTSLGVSGSLLTGLYKASSDIDLLIYGSRNCEKVYNALTSLVKEESNHVKSYSAQELKMLFEFRSKDTIMSFEDFVRTESRKVLQGSFHQRDYFVRCVKEWSEISEHYGSVLYEPLGDAKISATITNDSQMIFTPCIYSIGDVKLLEGVKVEPLSEIASFRGRFCEQARVGEKVIAYGKVERVKKRVEEEEHFRLLLGNKASDYMIRAE